MDNEPTAYLPDTCFSLHSDDVTIVVIATTTGFIALLLIIIAITLCFSKEKW